jgi:hypothetical protein
MRASGVRYAHPDKVASPTAVNSIISHFMPEPEHVPTAGATASNQTAHRNTPYLRKKSLLRVPSRGNSPTRQLVQPPATRLPTVSHRIYLTTYSARSQRRKQPPPRLQLPNVRAVKKTVTLGEASATNGRELCNAHRVTKSDPLQSKAIGQLGRS